MQRGVVRSGQSQSSIDTALKREKNRMMHLLRRHVKSVVTMFFWAALLFLCVAPQESAAQGQSPKPSAGESRDGAQATEGPRILIEETVYDFGEVYEGTTVDHGFTVKNTGSAVLNISQVRPG
jgi:hypothetical protein